MRNKLRLNRRIPAHYRAVAGGDDVLTSDKLVKVESVQIGNPVYLLKMTHSDYWRTEITVYKQGAGRMVFGGDAIWQWGMAGHPTDGSRDHIRNHGKNINWAEWLHNGLMGLHTCILYTGDEFCIHDRHDDYDFVARLFELGEMPNAEVLKLTGGIV